MDQGGGDVSFCSSSLIIAQAVDRKVAEYDLSFNIEHAVSGSYKG